jgi:hypothetical protein
MIRRRPTGHGIPREVRWPWCPSAICKLFSEGLLSNVGVAEAEGLEAVVEAEATGEVVTRDGVADSEGPEDVDRAGALDVVVYLGAGPERREGDGAREG